MDERLKMFTTEHGGIYDISRPWHYCGWDYATDRVVLVRVPAISSRETEIGNRKVPAAYAQFDPLPKRTKTIAWQEVNSMCATCPTCWQNIRPPKSIVVGNRMIARDVAEKIASLGDVFYADCGLHDQPLAFVASGGLEGRVMPVVEVE